jgi:hypothetical protein
MKNRDKDISLYPYCCCTSMCDDCNRCGPELLQLPCQNPDARPSLYSSRLLWFLKKKIICCKTLSDSFRLPPVYGTLQYQIRSSMTLRPLINGVILLIDIWEP